MLRLLQIASLLLVAGWLSIAEAKGPETVAVTVNNPIADKYKQIDFTACQPLTYEVFAKAYTGYLNLKTAGKLNSEKAVLTVCDYSLSSKANRMWIIDLQANKILVNTYVAHGQGSGEEFATSFSNTDGTHKSSMGFYVTGDTYNGSHGNSLYLHGMDDGYNNAAYTRSIVLHGAGYVSKDFISGTGRLGRSWGCPAVCADLCNEVIDYTKDGTCLYIHYPDNKFLAESRWLKQEVATNK